MQTKSVRFIKRFVLFARRVSLDKAGKLATTQEQYHIDFGELHEVSTFEPRSENSVFIEFAEKDRYSGTATVDKACIEMLGGGEILQNPCCNKR
jgi:hypothetical protein